MRSGSESIREGIMDRRFMVQVDMSLAWPEMFEFSGTETN